MLGNKMPEVRVQNAAVDMCPGKVLDRAFVIDALRPGAGESQCDVSTAGGAGNLPTLAVA